MPIQDLYPRKLVLAAEAVRQVRNDDFISVPTGVGEPPTLLTALSEQRRDFQGVKVAKVLAMRKYGYTDPATAQHVRHVAFFYGSATRAAGQEGWRAGSISFRTASPKSRPRSNAVAGDRPGRKR